MAERSLRLLRRRVSVFVSGHLSAISLDEAPGSRDTRSPVMRTLTLTLAMLAIAAPNAAAAASTGTVVVAAPGANVLHVGTSTVTVEPGTTVAQLAAQLAAKDGSAQTRTVVDATGAPKTG